MSVHSSAYQRCINPRCAATFGCDEVLFECPACGDLLDICYNWDTVPLPERLMDFSTRWATRNDRLDFSGVWRFRELLDFCPDTAKVSIGEGQTVLQQNCGLAAELGMHPTRLFCSMRG